MRARRLRLAVLAPGLAGALLIASGAPVRAEEALPVAPPAGASQAEEAGRAGLDLTLGRPPEATAIPWDRLDARAYALVRDVVGGALVAREVRDLGFRSRPEVLAFLMDHPDFAADVARALRQGKYRVRRAGDGFEADDGHGVRGVLTPVYAEGDRRLFHLAGRYDPGLLPAIDGRLVLLVDAPHVTGDDGVTYCDLRVSGYLRLDVAGGEVVARVAERLTDRYVDRRVRRFFRHVAALSRRAYDDPEGLALQLSGRGDLPADRLREFERLLLAHLPPDWARHEAFHLLERAPGQADEAAGPPAGR